MLRYKTRKAHATFCVKVSKQERITS